MQRRQIRQGGKRGQVGHVNGCGHLSGLFYAGFQMPLAGMEIRGSVPYHFGGLIIPV